MRPIKESLGGVESAESLANLDFSLAMRRFSAPFPAVFSLILLFFKGSAALAYTPPKEVPIDNLRPLFEPIEPTHVPVYMAPYQPEKRKDPPLPYTGLHKGPETVLMCLDSGLGCFQPETVAEWQALYLDAQGKTTVWRSPWGRDYLIPKGFNHRNDWVNAWQAASDNCDFEEKCHFPDFVHRARKFHDDLLDRLKRPGLTSLYQPFFQPDFHPLKSKGDLQYQCDRITFVCTPFINSEKEVAGIYRPFLPFTYVTPLAEPPKTEQQKRKAIALKPKQDLSANTGYMGSEAE